MILSVAEHLKKKKRKKSFYVIYILFHKMAKVILNICMGIL